MNLYVVRHGETIWNVERRVQGITDIPLTEKGKQCISENSTFLQKSIVFKKSSSVSVGKPTITSVVTLA